MNRASRLGAGVLGVGFAALLVAVVAARSAPARTYELSLYAATPTLYWVGLGVALFAALVVAVWARGRYTDWALALASTAGLAVVALPLLRGYYFFGSGDSLSHLGWVRDISTGTLDPMTLLYPGIHTVAILVGRVTGATFPRALQLTTLAFAAVYLVFLPLCVVAVGRHRLAAAVGVFSALLLLPVNNVSVHLMAHPITQSILFLPLVLYLAFRYVTRQERALRGVGPTPTGLLLGLVSVTMLLVHPQGALALIGMFVAVAGVQYYYRRTHPSSRVASHRPLYAPTAFLVAAFALWTPGHERITSTLVGVTTSLLGIGGGPPAAELTQRSASLTSVGGSLGELFVKLFLLGGVFALLGALLVLAWLAGALDDHPDRNALVGYLGAATVPLVGAFAVFFLASAGTQYFRYVGFVMVPASILGAVALCDGPDELPWRPSGRTIRLGLVACFVLFLPLSVATVYASPFVYQGNAQVTEKQVDGYRTAFAYRSEAVSFVSVRGGPERFVDAIYGTQGATTTEVPGESAVIPGSVFGPNLTDYYDGSRYVPVTEETVQRELALYRGFRYPAEGFTTLEYSPGVARVQTNGEFRLYLLRGEG